MNRQQQKQWIRYRSNQIRAAACFLRSGGRRTTTFKFLPTGKSGNKNGRIKKKGKKKSRANVVRLLVKYMWNNSVSKFFIWVVNWTVPNSRRKHVELKLISIQGLANIQRRKWSSGWGWPCADQRARRLFVYGSIELEWNEWFHRQSVS